MAHLRPVLWTGFFRFVQVTFCTNRYRRTNHALRRLSPIIDPVQTAIKKAALGSGVC